MQDNFILIHAFDFLFVNRSRKFWQTWQNQIDKLKAINIFKIDQSKLCFCFNYSVIVEDLDYYFHMI